MPKIQQEEKAKPQEREEWMNLSSAFACSSREKKVKKDDEKKKTCILDKPGQNSRELNPHWKNGGTGLPEDEIKKTDSKFMDAGWLRKSLQRAKEQAAEEGKTLEEISANRWGSLDKIKSMIEDAERKSRHSSASFSSRRYHDDERRKKQYRNRSRSRSRSRERSKRHYDNYKSDFNLDKKLSFKRPDDNYNVDSSSYTRPYNSSRKNWKKPEASDEKYKNIESTPSTSSVNLKKSKKHSSSSSSSSESGEDEVKLPNAADKILTEDELNKLGAKIIKAEIMGDSELANELRDKLENAREARKKNPKPIETVNNNKKEEENVILTTTNSRGMARPLEPRSRFEEPQGGRGKSKKVSTHESGERVRYFADDDKYSLREMFQKEKGESSSHQNDDAVFVKMASKSMDMDELFESRITKDESDAKQDLRDKMRAIKEHKKIEKSLDNCNYCFDSKKMLKHLIVAMGTKMYVSLPSYESLTSGHCIIAPIHHITCQTQLDEDFYAELKSFKKALTKMFTEHNECPVFFEVAMGLRRYPHMQLTCVSLPEDVGSMAPMYFKKALLECETEWSTNKKVVDLSKKDVRASIPKGLPYFMVDFGDYGGFAHVIEDEELFPRNFAQEIVGGMMDLDSNTWRRPRKQNFDQQRQKVIEFAEKWRKYDITL